MQRLPRPSVAGKFQKSNHAIIARAVEAPEFTVLDRKIFNILLHHSAADRRNKITMHRIAMRDLAEPLLQRHESMDRIRESLERLWRVKIGFEYQDEDGQIRSVRCHYLSYDSSKLTDGYLDYSFDPMLIRFLLEPRIYATIQLATANSFQSIYALKLYEVMQLQASKYDPMWMCTVEEAKAFFEIPPAYERFDNFKARVVEKAIEEVNQRAEFDVIVDYIKAGRGGKVTALKFRVVGKTPQRLVSAGDVGKSQVRKARDRNTVDLFEGVTDHERFTPPTLRADTLEAARAIVGEGGNVGPYRDRWIDENLKKGFSDKPDEQFLGWLSFTVAGERNARLEGIDADAFFDSLIDEIEG